MKMEFLYHSGVLLENEEVQVFIDSYKDISGVINKEKRVYFLASHGHSDHWHMDNFKYCGESVTYVLSRDITSSAYFTNKIDSGEGVAKWQNIISVEPYKDYKVKDLNISTYGSTDLGVSFVIEFDDKHIYHSGDLNWWHWENDTEDAQMKEAADYKSELGKIKNNGFDLAFVPVDPRLNGHCYLALDYFLNQFKTQVVIPIHYGSNYSITKGLGKRYIGKDSTVVEIGSSNFIVEI